MKPKLIIVAALCAIGWAAHAQTDKNQGIAGLTLSLGTAKQKTYRNNLNNFTFAPRVAYFLGNNFALGLELSFNLSKLRGVKYTYWDSENGIYQNTYGARELNFGISPFARKYFNVKNYFKVFAQANFLFQINSTKIIDDEDYLIRYDNRLKGVGASLSPGFAFFPNLKMSIEFSFPIVTYFHQSYYDSESMYNYDRTNNLRLALDNFTPTIGIHAHF